MTRATAEMDVFRTLRAVILIDIDAAGRLIDANDGFYHMAGCTPGEESPDLLMHFGNPTIRELTQRMPQAVEGGVIFQGLMTMDDRQGASHSLIGTVFRHENHLRLVAEFDIDDIARMSEAVMQLNADLAEQHRALARANRQLEREKNAQARLLNELATRQAQLLQAEKLASIGMMAAGVAHEINTPIGFVRSNLTSLGQYFSDLQALIDVYAGASERLKKDPGLWAEIDGARSRCDLDYLREDVVALLAESRDGLSRVARIVQDLRDFSCIDAAEWQVVNLSQTLDSVLNVASHACRDRAAVIRDYRDLPAINCCPGQLNQVFMSVLLNAIESMDTPGTIHVRTGQEGDAVWVEIEDGGCGIAPEDIDRIFDPFFTTKPIGHGTGLGLSAAWGIVSAHGGRFEVHSTPRQGTCVRVWLPISGPGGAAPPSDPLCG
jgi:signal transduction histidine kinase